MSFEFRKMRAMVMKSTLEMPVVIYKESPLFYYFSEDDRADGVIIEDGNIYLYGSKFIDDNFVETIPEKVCCPSSSYIFRKCNDCNEKIEKCFTHPFTEEIETIRENNVKMNTAIVNTLQSSLKGSTENKLSEEIEKTLVSNGFMLYYQPIVAGDLNINRPWHKPGEYIPEKVLYVEASARKAGLSSLFSETFILREEDYIVNLYSSIIKGIEFIRDNFIEGMSSDFFSKIDDLRNEKLYLTTPLFPYTHISIPGNNTKIHTLDTSVFDLWSSGKEITIRKKIVAVAGSHRASII